MKMCSEVMALRNETEKKKYGVQELVLQSIAGGGEISPLTF